MRFACAALAAAAAFSIGSAAAAQQMSADPSTAPAGTYAMDKAHTSVTMKVAHMGLSFYTLRFDKVDGSLAYDPANPAASKLQVSIDPRSIDTDNPAFNTEIADQFFDAGQFPTIAFVSTGAKVGSGNHGQVTGALTFHGQTRPVTLDVVFNGTGKGMGPGHEQRMGFSGTTTIRRSEFGASKYVPLVGDDVTVLIETEFTK